MSHHFTCRTFSSILLICLNLEQNHLVQMSHSDLRPLYTPPHFYYYSFNMNNNVVYILGFFILCRSQIKIDAAPLHLTVYQKINFNHQRVWQDYFLHLLDMEYGQIHSRQSSRLCWKRWKAMGIVFLIVYQPKYLRYRLQLHPSTWPLDDH